MSLNSFELGLPSKVVFGRGVSKDAAQLATQMGRSILLVTGKQTQRVQSIIDLLQHKAARMTHHIVTGEPTVWALNAGVAKARDAGCDAVLAVGGGSTLDMGKAIAAMLNNPGDPLEYLEVVGAGQPLINRSVPCITVPTTAGTGAEVTRNAVLCVEDQHVKVSLRSPLILPAAAYIDPDMTKVMPPSITATTGCDALLQLMEAYTTRRSNPLTDMLCVNGLKQAFWALPAAVEDGDNMDAREAMCLASLYSGIALTNAGLGAIHGFAAAIGGLTGARHGATCAALAPSVLRTNIKAIRERCCDCPVLGRYQQLAAMATQRDDAPAEALADWLEDLIVRLHIPTLKEQGLSADALPQLVSQARQASSMKGNPIELTEEEMLDTLTAAGFTTVSV